jgi:alkyldihydroxyacetonephosphate synthase
MRFFLQAREFSSLGGWIGHYATVYSQIDDPRNFASAAL